MQNNDFGIKKYRSTVTNDDFSSISIANFFNRLELLARAQRRFSLGIGDIGDTFTDLTRLHHHPHPDGVDDVMAQVI